MKKIISTFLLHVLAFNLTLGQFVYGQQPNPSSQSSQDERVVVSSNEVVLDAVVKDKKGRPIRDLSTSDFEIYEDGVRQQIKSMRLVNKVPQTGGGTTTTNGENAAQPSPSGDRPNVPAASGVGASAVALVFDRLSPEARSLARDAALSYVGEGATENGYIGVFNIDLSLHVVQPYTTNTQLLREAINNTGSRTSTSHSSGVDQIQQISQRQETVSAQTRAAETAAAGGGQGNAGGAAAAAAGGGQAERIFLEMTQRSLEVFEMLERDQQGYATTNGLLAVVNSMRNLPGRKAVVFFSEGLSIPPGVQSYFRSVVNTANRAGVSIYAVDAAGLRVFSGNDAARREISRMANASANRGGDEPIGRPLTMGLERNEDLLRANPQSGLGQLANETGGFLISDTNNLSGRIRQIDEDLSTYYLLTYTPQNQNYDGRFRQITVKVDRSNTEIQARKGYFAINASFGSPVLAYEAPALAVLSGNSRPDAFPIQVGAFSFPEGNRPGLVSVLVEAPNESITFSTDKVKKTYNTDFSVVVLVRDAAKQIVKKMSNQYVITGPIDKLDAGKRGEVLFYREAELPPGRYSIEAAVYDALASKTSVRTAILDVPVAADSKLRLSDVVLIKRAEKVSPPTGPNTSINPFMFGELLAYPNLNQSVSKSKNRQMALLLTAYVQPGQSKPPKLIMNFLQGGRSIGQTSAEMPAPDAAGRIQYATAIPLDKFQPGVYDLRVEIADAQSSTSRQTRIIVDP